MIYRFTNSKGNFRFGVAVEMIANGAYILGDAWEPTEKTSLPASFGYISFEPNPYVSGSTSYDLLPLDAPVQWRTPEIAQIIGLMKSGQFAEWWQQHRPEIVRKFGSGYRKGA